MRKSHKVVIDSFVNGESKISGNFVSLKNSIAQHGNIIVERYKNGYVISPLYFNGKGYTLSHTTTVFLRSLFVALNLPFTIGNVKGTPTLINTNTGEVIASGSELIEGFYIC